MTDEQIKMIFENYWCPTFASADHAIGFGRAIRASAIEEAAKVAEAQETHGENYATAALRECAAAIRALIGTQSLGEK